MDTNVILSNIQIDKKLKIENMSTCKDFCGPLKSMFFKKNQLSSEPHIASVWFTVLFW